MPISRLGLVACVFVVAGCDGALPSLGEFNVLERVGVGRSAPDEIALPDGLVVAGAEGWCVDERSSRLGRTTSVVVMGSCAALSGGADAPRPSVQGFVTVSVESAEEAVPSLDELQSFFGTDQGRATLAFDGQADSVEVNEMFQDDSHLVIYTTDASVTLPGADQDRWRAVMDVQGRFVTVSLVGWSDAPIARDEGVATLDAQADRLLAANLP